MGLFVDRIREITGLVKVSSRLYATPWQEVPGIAAADALDAGDAMGTRFEFTVPERGIIIAAKLIDPDDDTLLATLHVFSAPFTATANDAALAISAADATFWVTSIPLTATTDLGAGKVAEYTAINSPYHAPGTRLYCQCSTAGTPTIAAGAMPRVRLYILPCVG